MIPKAYAEKAIQFEVSLGNAGNNFDGYLPSFNIGGEGGSDVEEDEEDEGASQAGSVFSEDGGDDDEAMEREAMAEWESLTNRYTPKSPNNYNYFLDIQVV